MSSPRFGSSWGERPAPPPHVTFPTSYPVEEQALLDDDSDDVDEVEGTNIPYPEGRRSSVSNRLAAMADIGGPNSFRSFARSWQRAASFAEVIPRRPSFVYASEQSGDEIEYGRSVVEGRSVPQSGLLRQHLNEAGTGSSQAATSACTDDFRARERKSLDAEMAGALGATPSSRSSIFAVPPHLSSPSVIGSYGSYTQYGTIGGARRRSRPSFGGVEAVEVGTEEDSALGEEQPILIKEVKQGDKVVYTVEGQSTLPQSIFNSINAIIGVGLLSLPLAFKMSGWILGLGILSLTAAVTAHTGNLLGKCMQYDVSLITYSDLAYVSFGPRARVVVSALFTLELVAACVALVILFSDSLALLLPSLASVTTWKCICAVLILILNALPLRWLSYTSVVGIFSTFCSSFFFVPITLSQHVLTIVVVVIIAVDGLIKTETPGSLWEPAATYLLPSNWLSLPLAYGLMASPWGAHSVFPSVYRDMRHPHKWAKAVQVTFSFSYILDTCLAVIGILMFGDGISDAITSNIIATSGYPETLTFIMCACVAIIPLTKIPLSARPLITTVDVICNLHIDSHSPPQSLLTRVLRAIIRVSVVLVLLFISVVFPAFDSVCAFLGAALCTLISVILPISFYLKLYWKDIPLMERTISWILIVIFAILGIVGTIWTFLPKDLVGA